MAARTWGIVAATSAAMMVAASIAGSLLEKRGPVPYALKAGIIATVISAFVLFAVAIPPLALRAFLSGQVAIGNAELPLVAFLVRNETNVVRGFWVLMAAGLAIAVPVILRELGFKI